MLRNAVDTHLKHGHSPIGVMFRVMLQSVVFLAACSHLTYASDKIEVWVNAFIPTKIDGLTHKIPDGPHKGKTAIHGPVSAVNDCFLTDQRSFSKSRKASSRIQALLTIEVNDEGGVPTWKSKAKIGETIEVDCEDGDVECKRKASDGNVKWTLKSKTSTTLIFRLEAEASNPCFTGSPDIDMIGELKVDLAAKNATFVGKVDKFPAFEMYAVVNGDSSTLFRQPVKKGATPSQLFGEATEKVKGEFSW